MKLTFRNSTKNFVHNMNQRNIEIKARINGDDSEFLKRIEIGKELTNTSEAVIIKQHDVFFNVPEGRLKLRYLENARSQLVQYDRPDILGPKLSTYNKIEIDEPAVLEKMLTASLGVKGVVKKTRHLFIYNHSNSISSRIHLDQVEGLGHFLEFEVCLQPENTIEQGAQITELLQRKFSIEPEDLIATAYLDEILNK